MQVNALCDRSILLMKGKIAAVGAPLDVFNAYRELYVEHENKRLGDQHEKEVLSPIAGDGAVSVTKVVFRDAAGEPSNAFFTGGPMTIELSVERHRPGNRYHVFIGFLMGSQYIGHIDSENLITQDAVKSLAIDAERLIRINIEQLVLLNGEFTLWILLQDAATRETITEYRGIGIFRVAKRHYPFDADSYFAQPVTSIEVDAS